VSRFERYLPLWVIACMIAGTILGSLLPGIPAYLSKLAIAGISIPVTLLIWAMIYPMMAQIDFSRILAIRKNPKGIAITTTVNWLIKPFTMFGIAYLFFKIVFSPFIGPSLANEYLAGAILLGAAPCTAMVFVWSYLAKGDSAYTLVQVAINDLILMVLYAPLVMLLLGISNIVIPYGIVVASVVLFVVVPLVMGWLSRIYVRDLDTFLKRISNVPIVGLLTTLVLIFMFQGHNIIENPFHILLIAIPLTIQTYLIFGLTFGWAWLWKLKHEVAAPAGFIGASNFFELAVALAIALFGLHSGATLVTVVGVLVEVPLMLHLVSIANKSRRMFA